MDDVKVFFINPETKQGNWFTLPINMNELEVIGMDVDYYDENFEFEVTEYDSPISLEGSYSLNHLNNIFYDLNEIYDINPDIYGVIDGLISGNYMGSLNEILQNIEEITVYKNQTIEEVALNIINEAIDNANFDDETDDGTYFINKYFEGDVHDNSLNESEKIDFIKKQINYNRYLNDFKNDTDFMEHYNDTCIIEI